MPLELRSGEWIVTRSAARKLAWKIMLALAGYTGDVEDMVDSDGRPDEELFTDLAGIIEEFVPGQHAEPADFMAEDEIKEA